MLKSDYEQDIYSTVFEKIIWLLLIIACLIFAPLFIIIVIAALLISYRIEGQTKLIHQQNLLLQQLINQNHNPSKNINKGVYIDEEG